MPDEADFHKISKGKSIASFQQAHQVIRVIMNATIIWHFNITNNGTACIEHLATFAFKKFKHKKVRTKWPQHCCPQTCIFSASASLFPRHLFGRICRWLRAEGVFGEIECPIIIMYCEEDARFNTSGRRGRDSINCYYILVCLRDCASGIKSFGKRLVFKIINN